MTGTVQAWDVWRAALPSLIEQLKGRAFEAAWVSGSVVEGLGNPSSDLDLFVVVRDEGKWPTEHPRDVPYLGNSQVHSWEVWTWDRVQELAGRVRDLPVGRGSKAILERLDESEIEFIHRLRVGEPLSKEATFEQLRALFDFERFALYLAENQLINLDDAFDDAVGMLEIGQLPSAALRARVAVEGALGLLLFSRGLTNHKEKHRERLLSSLAQKDDFVRQARDHYWSRVGSLPSREGELGEYVARALHFVEGIVDEIECRRIA